MSPIATGSRQASPAGTAPAVQPLPLRAGAPSSDRCRIFVSYRREDADSAVFSLGKELRDRFGDYQVFVDTHESEGRLGEDFTRRILEELGSCEVLVAVIGPRWLDARDRSGNRRLDDPDDWVRNEIATGLAKPGAPVIPVLVDGMKELGAADLPLALGGLARRDWLELRRSHWEHDLPLLLRRIEQIVRKRDAGLRGAASLGLAAAAVTALALVSFRAVAPLYSVGTPAAVLTTLALAVAAGVPGWLGLAGSRRWLASLSRAAWRFAVWLLPLVVALGFGYRSLRPLVISVEERPVFSPCQSLYLVQPYVWEGNKQGAARLESGRRCETEFAGRYQRVRIRTGWWGRSGTASLALEVRDGGIAAVLVPTANRKDVSDRQRDIPPMRQQLAVGLPLEDAGSYVCWFTLASFKQRACVSATLVTQGGSLLGTDTTCPPVP